MTAWTPDDDARLVALYNGGASRDEVAAALGRSEPTIRKRIERLRDAGVDIPKRRRGGFARAAKFAPAGPRNAAPKAVTRERPCLCCRRPMVSTGAHHRLCDRCRPSDGLPAQWGHV